MLETLRATNNAYEEPIYPTSPQPRAQEQTTPENQGHPQTRANTPRTQQKITPPNPQNQNQTDLKQASEPPSNDWEETLSNALS
jgi:hypothetical protein